MGKQVRFSAGTGARGVNLCTGWNRVPPSSCPSRTSECDFSWKFGQDLGMQNHPGFTMGSKSDDWGLIGRERMQSQRRERWCEAEAETAVT